MIINRDLPPEFYSIARGTIGGVQLSFIPANGLRDVWSADWKGRTYGPMRWKSLIDILESKIIAHQAEFTNEKNIYN